MTSVSTSVTAEGDYPIEGVVLAFVAVHLKYKPHQNPDGTLNDAVHFT